MKNVSCLNSILAATALVSGLAAQSTVVYPTTFTAREGQGGEAGFALAKGVGRTQLHFQGDLLPVPGGARLIAAGFRQDGSPALADVSHRIQLEMFAGHTTRTGAQFSSNYENNYTTPKATVFNRKIFDLPERPAPVVLPSPNVTMIPFDTPFQFDSAQNLVLDLVVTANTNQNGSFRYSADVALFDTVSTIYGTSCPDSNSLLARLTANEVALGGQWRVALASAPRSAGAALAVGVGNTNHAGLPLPFDMAPLGAPGCMILVDVVTMFTGFTSSSGAATFTLTIPDNLSLDGAALYGQSIVLDAFANHLGLITTNGVRTRFGRNTPVQVVQHTGDPTRATGSVTRNHGVVTLFTF